MVSLLLLEVVIASCLGLVYILVFPGRRGKNLPPGMTSDISRDTKKASLIFCGTTRSSHFAVDRQSPPAPQEWSPFQVKASVSQTVELKTLTADQGLLNGLKNTGASFP